MLTAPKGSSTHDSLLAISGNKPLSKWRPKGLRGANARSRRKKPRARRFTSIASLGGMVCRRTIEDGIYKHNGLTSKDNRGETARQKFLTTKLGIPSGQT